MATATASPITTFDFTLTPQALGGTAFGVSALPSGPFTLSVTIDGALQANMPAATHPVVAVTFNANGHIFTLPDFSPGPGQFAEFTTDATASVNSYLFFFDGPQVEVRVDSFTTNSAWFAGDKPLIVNGCGFSNDLPPQINGNGCIAGTAGRSVPGLPLIPNSVSLRVTSGESSVPEPATLTLLGLALLGLGLARRQRVSYSTDSKGHLSALSVPYCR